MAITYRVTANPGNITAEGDSSPIVVTGLTNGVDYTFTIVAINEYGTSPASSPSIPERVATVPSAVAAPTLTPGVMEMDVDWNAPANGGLAIDGYYVHVSPGNTVQYVIGTRSITLTNLSDRTEYSVSISARNGKGEGATGSSAAATTVNVPGAPTVGTPTRSASQTVSVPFSAPADDGGLTITNYEVESTPGSFTNTGTGSPISVSGLTNGTSYTFKVRATNSIGWGPQSSASSAATPYTVPDAPGMGYAEALQGAAKVYFNVPSSDGGSTITGYTAYAYKASDESQVGSQTGSASPITVSGLTAGVAVKLKVKATNAAGDSSLSSYSGEVTPTASATVPDAPTVVSAYANGPTSATINFTANGDGGSEITGYTAQAQLVASPYTTYNQTGGPSATNITVSGLTVDTAYYIRVKATNAIGDSNWAEYGSTVTTYATVPSAPQGPLASSSGNNGYTNTTFNASSSNGGAGIQCYEVTLNNGTVATSNASPVLISGLAATSYTVTGVRAFNRVGQSSALGTTGFVIPTRSAPNLPGIPTSVSATSGTESATVTFTAPSWTGGGITGYRVYIYDESGGSSYQTASSSPYTVTGLTGGANYRFGVAAVSSTGVGGKSQRTSNIVPGYGGGPP